MQQKGTQASFRIHKQQLSHYSQKAIPKYLFVLKQLSYHHINVYTSKELKKDTTLIDVY